MIKIKHYIIKLYLALMENIPWIGKIHISMTGCSVFDFNFMITSTMKQMWRWDETGIS